MSQATITTSITSPSKSDETDLYASKEVFKIAVQVIGIKKRCRKSERHFFHFGHMPYNNGNYDHAALVSKVESFLQTNMRAVVSLTRIHLDYVVIRNENGFTVTEWQPFHEKNIKFEINCCF